MLTVFRRVIDSGLCALFVAFEKFYIFIQTDSVLLKMKNILETHHIFRNRYSSN